MESAYIKFNGGIWSDVLKGRYDLANYKSASRTCSNFTPTRYGQIEKRPGTEHVGYAKGQCVLKPFQFSVDTKFVLEFGNEYIRFWKEDGGLVQQESTPGTPEEVATPYQQNELYEVQIRAINDVVYIVHPNHPVGILTRVADNNWTYASASLTGPFVDPDVNSLDNPLIPNGTTGSININSPDGILSADMVGSILRLKYITSGSNTTFSDSYMSLPFTYDTTTYTANDNAVVFDPLAAVTTYGPNNATEITRVWSVVGGRHMYYRATATYDYAAWSGVTTYTKDFLVSDVGVVYNCETEGHLSATAPASDATNWKVVVTPADAPAFFEYGVVAMQPETVSGEWSLQTTGNWTGEWIIQRSLDFGGTWLTVRSLSSNDDSNYLVEEDEEGDSVQIRILGGAKFTSDQQQPVTFTILSTEAYGTAEVTAFTDANNVTATVIDDMPATTASISWQESAFSPRQGYPRTVALFDNRLIFAATGTKPQAFFYSGINDYNNFLGGTDADEPFYVETLSDDQSAVQWLAAQRELFIGTASVEGVLLTRKQDEAQSPENLPIIRWQESMGSAYRPAMMVRDGLMVLQRGRQTINSISYSLEQDGYRGEEVTLLCPHLFTSGILEMTHIREPYTGVYVVTEAGTICHMVFEPTLQVTGWCEYTTTGGEYESITSLPGDGAEDFLYASVKRTINGVEERHIEKFVTGNTLKQQNNDADNLWYLDNAIKAEGNYVSVSGLDHLEGEVVTALENGNKKTYTVSSGSITLDNPVEGTIIVGIPITSTFEPLDLEGEGTYGKRKQLYQTKLMMWRSLGGYIAVDGKDYQQIVYHTAGDEMDESIPLRDGYSEIFHESRHARQKYWRLQHDEPYPFTVQAVVQTFTVSKQ